LEVKEKLNVSLIERMINYLHFLPARPIRSEYLGDVTLSDFTKKGRVSLSTDLAVVAVLVDVLPLDACVVVPLVVPLAPCGCCLTQTGGACANDLVEDIAVLLL
jgi:hypothetical protein